jgi:hypothetical protein
MLWVVSVARVALAFHDGETFGVEATIAFLLVVVLPLVTWDAIAARYQKSICIPSSTTRFGGRPK